MSWLIVIPVVHALFKYLEWSHESVALELVSQYAGAFVPTKERKDKLSWKLGVHSVGQYFSFCEKCENVFPHSLPWIISWTITLCMLHLIQTTTSHKQFVHCQSKLVIHTLFAYLWMSWSVSPCLQVLLCKWRFLAVCLSMCMAVWSVCLHLCMSWCVDVTVCCVCLNVWQYHDSEYECVSVHECLVVCLFESVSEYMQVWCDWCHHMFPCFWVELSSLMPSGPFTCCQSIWGTMRSPETLHILQAQGTQQRMGMCCVIVMVPEVWWVWHKWLNSNSSKTARLHWISLLLNQPWMCVTRGMAHSLTQKHNKSSRAFLGHCICQKSKVCEKYVWSFGYLSWPLKEGLETWFGICDSDLAVKVLCTWNVKHAEHPQCQCWISRAQATICYVDKLYMFFYQVLTRARWNTQTLLSINLHTN